MRRPGTALLGLVAAVVANVPAEAQSRRPPRTGEASITLYELPDYKGRSISLYADSTNLRAQAFNDMARSARIEGLWRLCADASFRDCEPFGDDVRDFADYRMGSVISSVQQVGGRPGRPGFEGPTITRPILGRDGVEGLTTVFFRRPSLNGADVAAAGQGSADAFCRKAGHGEAVYFDDNHRAREVVDVEGRPQPGSPVLRDVLCRR